jgi:hypothetical protein
MDPALLWEMAEQFDNPDVASLGGGDLECGVRLGIVGKHHMVRFSTNAN